VLDTFLHPASKPDPLLADLSNGAIESMAIYLASMR
jgi:hypothetical protein